jgi:3-hydroxyisobutyrate dehydrogenase-like beta-hydroxyacid dehydrogenase
MDSVPIGFVGLGNMGQPLSRNLLAAGFRVLGYDPKPSIAFQEAGGQMVASVAELGDASAIVLSLPSVNALRGAVDAFLPNCRPGQLVIDLSSYALDDKRAQAERLAERGVTMLDCEISGLPAMAQIRKAVIFKSGNAEAAMRAEPIFNAMAEEHFFLGEFGAATRLKLIANTMVCVHNLMAAEALNLGARAGLAPEAIVKVLGPSAAGSATFRMKTPLMLRRQFENGSGPFRHMFGYLARAKELAENAGAATPLLDVARAVYAKAEAENRHDQDIAAILEIVEHISAKEG